MKARRIRPACRRRRAPSRRCAILLSILPRRGSRMSPKITGGSLEQSKIEIAEGHERATHAGTRERIAFFDPDAAHRRCARARSLCRYRCDRIRSRLARRSSRRFRGSASRNGARDRRSGASSWARRPADGRGRACGTSAVPRRKGRSTSCTWTRRMQTKYRCKSSACCSSERCWRRTRS